MVTNTDLDVPKNDAELIEMERLMRSAPEPGGMENVSMGEEGVSVRGTTAKSAGHVTMWNTDTREPSVFNLNTIRTKLREVFPANYEVPAKRGKPCWTATEPSEPPWKGTATCPLHADRPERAAYDVLGYVRCTYDVAPNEMEAQEHLRKKHPQTWRMMREAEGQTEKKADSKNRDVMGKILAKLAGVDLDETEPTEFTELSVNHEAAEASTFHVTVDFPNENVYACGKCKKNHKFSTKAGKRHLKHRV